MLEYRTLETVIHKMEEKTQDLSELQSQVGLKHTAMMTERELAADARDQTLKCTQLLDYFVTDYLVNESACF